MKLFRRSVVQSRLVELQPCLRLRESLKLVFFKKQCPRRRWDVRNLKRASPITSTASFQLISITAGNDMRLFVIAAPNFPVKSCARSELAIPTFPRSDLYLKVSTK